MVISLYELSHSILKTTSELCTTIAVLPFLKILKNEVQKSKVTCTRSQRYQGGNQRQHVIDVLSIPEEIIDNLMKSHPIRFSQFLNFQII